jgi:hypothetical protein
VNTNDELVIWHRGTSSNEWISLTNSPAIQTGVWTRVAIHKAYASHRYQVVINEASAISDSRGWSSASGGSHPGPWFDMVQTNGYMTRFRTQGELAGYLDDMVFTNRGVTYSSTNFAEAAANDGSIATTNTITLYGDTFVNTTYSAGTHFSTSGVPAGLSVALSYVSPTTINVTLTGNASPHKASESTTGMGLTLADSIFTLGNAADVGGYDRSDLSVSFDDPPVLSFSTTNFVESVANDGSIVNAITITLDGDTFADPLTAGVHYTTSGVPAGLSLSLLRNDDTNLTVSLTGNATANGDANDTTMTLSFDDSAFANVTAANITGSTKNLSVDFADTAALTYSTATYTETVANDGSISGGTISLEADTFTGSIGTDYVSGGEVSVSGLPSGLTAAIVKSSLTAVTVSFAGTADSHASSNDVSNLSFVFQNAAFSGGNASAIADTTRSDLTIDFNDPPVLTYSGTTFTEASNNDGTIGNTLTLTLSGDTFVDDGDFNEGDEYTVANEPDGLSISVTRDSDSQLTLSLSGTATPNEDGNDVSDLTFNLQNAAFTTVAAAHITDASRSDLAVDFNDAPTISYSGTIFSELSNGSIDNTDPIEITISGDTFTGSYNSDFVADGKVTPANVPSGLALVLRRINSTTLLVTLTGTADAHADLNDVNNLGITFLDAAITAADADQVTGYSRSDLQIDYNDSTLAINVVPYSESFESYTDGYAIGADEGWQSIGDMTVTSETAIVSALTSGFSAFPIETNHTQVLRIGAETTAEIKSSSGEVVYSDMMFFVTPREAAPSGSTDYQFAMFVDTNQTLNLWHRDTSGTPSNAWINLSAVSVTTGAWHRVTIEKNYATQMYRLCLDGSSAAVNNPTRADAWFNMVGTANSYMSRIRVLGATGATPTYLDDITVTEQMPDTLISGTVFRFR